MAAAEAWGPDLRCVVAPNPGPFTERGTNSWILGRGSVCVIDPGPESLPHLDALLAALGGARVEAILVTHAHRDHSGLATPLAERTGAPVLAFGDAFAGRREAEGDVGGGWGVDEGFAPDRRVADGEVLEGDGWRLRAIHTPGHMGNHLCLDDGQRLWTGDHAMGFATSLVSPPEGDMGDYVASLQRLLALGPRRLLPGHGAPVEDGAARLRDLLAHRRAREAEILAALEAGPADARSIAERLYTSLPAPLRRAAERNVLAHLLDLRRRGLATTEGPVSDSVAFRRVGGLDAAKPGC